MQIQKTQIISDLICYGPCPLADEEVEQHLTISTTGRVWFTGYDYGAGFDNYVIGRRQQFSIGKEEAAKLLEYISAYYENNETELFATDIGSWTLKITDTDGHKYEKTGSMCGGVTTEDIDLTDYIKKNIPVDDLAVFGGDFEEEDASEQNSL